MSILICFRYINEPIIYLYIMASTVSEEGSHNNFKFDAISLFIASQSNISNLFRISTAYFPWIRKVYSKFCHTSNFKNRVKILVVTPFETEHHPLSAFCTLCIGTLCTRVIGILLCYWSFMYPSMSSLKVTRYQDPPYRTLLKVPLAPIYELLVLCRCPSSTL